MEEYRYLQYLAANSEGRFRFFIDSASRWFILMDVEVLLDDGNRKAVRCFLPNPSGEEGIAGKGAASERITIVLQHVLSQNLETDESERHDIAKELEHLHGEYLVSHCGIDHDMISS